ncbi:MAG: hypothetical protein H7226_07830 [Salinibacterium sp.]|nr:hypothetical protein [Salinibacterium sp.]
MDVITGIAVAVVTALVVVGGAVAVGFAALFRRRGDRSITAPSASGSPAFGFGSAPLEELSTRADSMLVHTDDAVRRSDDELGFAIAQFGAQQVTSYGQAIASARATIADAFRLRQALDDSAPDSDRQQREWTLQIIALCERADSILAEQDAAFAGRRQLEVNAPATLSDLRARNAATEERLGDVRITLARLEATYAPGVVAGISGNVVDAETQLTQAVSIANAAASGVTQTGVSAVSDTLDQASAATRRAEYLLDAVERTERDLDAADTAVRTLHSSARADLVEAKIQRDSAPDADTGSAIIESMAAVDAALVADGLRDPVSDLDRIGAAIARLDAALASARNQADRLAHARAAYAGTLVSAASQIAVVRDLISSRGGGVNARTRLAEAERQYALAQLEADPVEALDTVRRAVTLARDADALARYSG